MEDLLQIAKKGRIIAKANEFLTPEISARLGAVYGTFLGGKGIVVIARDYLNNSRMLKRAFLAGGMSAGLDILNLHSAPAPLVQFCIRRFGASGGVYFSSGHSYAGDTAIRFFDSSGIEYSQKKIASFNEFYKKNKIIRARPNEIGSLSDILQTFDVYKKAIPQFVNKKLISRSNLKVVMDISHGPIGELSPEILNSLNVRVITLNTYYKSIETKLFPNIESIRDTSVIVKASDADLGVIFDSDGSRVLILDETGTPVEFEELFMMFLANEESIQKKKGSPIITTSSCSRIVDDFAKSLGFTIKRILNLPGEISNNLRQLRGAFGAADTFKFYFPEYAPFSDGTLILLKILEILAKSGEPLSFLIRTFPKTLKSHKTVNVSKYILENYNRILQKHLTENEDVITLDIIHGYKYVFDDKGWVKVIPSIYRDALLFSSESKDRKTSEELINIIESYLREEQENLEEQNN